MEQRVKTPPVFSKRLRAGSRRTYFFDVRTTRSNDYYLTITESKKRHDESYDRHKIFLYKEDFNKFVEALDETVNEVKTKYLPEYDFDEFSKREPAPNPPQQEPQATVEKAQPEEPLPSTEPAAEAEPPAADPEPSEPAPSANEEAEKWD